MKQGKSISGEPHYYSPRLKRKLNKIRFARTTIVEAPSGYGKTTAVGDFLEKKIPQGVSVHWFTAADELPAAGYRRLCREMEKIDSHVGGLLLNIGFPNAATVGEAAEALRSIRCESETYLVIDNFQLLCGVLPPAFILALIEHGGEGLHIVIVTQMLPRDVMAAIAGRGFLHITSADLRFSAEDIRNYYSLAGITISTDEAQAIERNTEGWIIAVYLQLRSLIETGAVSDTQGILALMELLVWRNLTEAQQECLLRLSPLETVSIQQACALLGHKTLPGFVLEALESPFIRFDPQGQRYEQHSILGEMLSWKRRERGASFERECFLRAGDLCRDEGKVVEAFGFYAKVGDYERMLSLDLSHLTLEVIGDRPFCELAADIARSCPADIKKKNLLSMLQIAWALLMGGMDLQFDDLMLELRLMLEGEDTEEVSGLLGEWTLLSSFRAYPQIKEMTNILRVAAGLFKGQYSRVILPFAPWWFGSHSPFSDFHTRPGEADKEAEEFEEYIALYSKLTNGNGSGADVLFRAELAYHRGDLTEAEILAYKAVYIAESKQQSIIQLGATTYLAHIALHKADATGWQNAINSMERAASFPLQHNMITRSVVDIVRGVLFNELHYQKKVADWLKKGDFSRCGLRYAVVYNAQFVYLSYLMHQGEFHRLIGTLEAIISEDDIRTYPFRELLLYLILAVGYISVGNRVRAEDLVNYAAKRALPDGLIYPFVGYSWLLQGKTEELIKRDYPELWDKFNEIKERFETGWTKLHDEMIRGELPADLTPREYEVAQLAAAGLRNSEIAEKLVVTESTVRAHLRTIFQKLEIDRRAKLAEKLK